MMRSVSVILLIALFPAAAAAQEPDLGTEAQREAGRVLYMEKCAQCHGETGQGDGIAEPYMRPMPRDFTAGVYKVRTTASGELPTDDDLIRIIRNGMPYTGMPAWPGLSAGQIENLVYFIKTFNDDFAGPYGVPEVVEIPSAPGMSEETVARGRVVYEENQCFDCHGAEGRGDGPSAKTLQDQWGNHLRPADMTKRWTFIGGTTREDIYRTFTTGLDGSPMPSYTIEPIEDRWALVDFVYSLSEDEPDYSTVVSAQAVDGPIDITQGHALFGEERGAFFPVVGQVIEPGRTFMPGVDAVEVKALYSDDELAVMVAWNDMSAETSGSNSPTMDVPSIERVKRDTAATPYSDAVAVQIPAAEADGTPYFLFGDARNPVDLWYADLAAEGAEFLVGRGSESVVVGEDSIEVYAAYEEGKWVTIFKAPHAGRFEEGSFVPIAFSVWDGFNDERGNRRGITAWYHLYFEPLERPSAVLPMLRASVLTLLLLLSIVGFVRWKHRRPVSA